MAVWSKEEALWSSQRLFIFRRKINTSEVPKKLYVLYSDLSSSTWRKETLKNKALKRFDNTLQELDPWVLVVVQEERWQLSTWYWFWRLEREERRCLSHGGFKRMVHGRRRGVIRHQELNIWPWTMEIQGTSKSSLAVSWISFPLY